MDGSYPSLRRPTRGLNGRFGAVGQDAFPPKTRVTTFLGSPAQSGAIFRDSEEVHVGFGDWMRLSGNGISGKGFSIIAARIPARASLSHRVLARSLPALGHLSFQLLDLDQVFRVER